MAERNPDSDYNEHFVLTTPQRSGYDNGDEVNSLWMELTKCMYMDGVTDRERASLLLLS